MSWKGMRTMPEDVDDGACPLCGVNPSTESDYGLCDCIFKNKRPSKPATVAKPEPFTPDAEWLRGWAGL